MMEFGGRQNQQGIFLAHEFLSLVSSSGAKFCFRQLTSGLFGESEGHQQDQGSLHVIFNSVSSKVPKFCFRMVVKGDQGQGPIK